MLSWQRFSNPQTRHVSNPASTVDEDAAERLRLYVDNDRRFAPTSPDGRGHQAAVLLLRRMKAGTYDSHFALGVWNSLVNDASKAYQREFGAEAPHFSVATRRHVAAQVASRFERSRTSSHVEV